MIVIVAGTSLINSHLFHNWDEIPVDTPYGRVSVRKASQYLFLQRHGKKNVPPHKINHHANVWALKSLGVKGAVAINSVGSLKLNIKPGMFVIPDDFVSFCNIPSFFDFDMRFTIPVMDSEYAQKLYRICTKLGMDISLGGVYIQTAGPRFETRAEVNILKRFGDLVGMTMGSEATLFMEYSIPYVSLCSVDNYCNGIMKAPLTAGEVEENILRNSRTIEAVLQTILAEGF